MPCTNTCSNLPAYILARSFHVGGAQVAMADGSIRFVSNSINVGVWNAVGSKSGGETVGEF
jgi:prepilin-type processing-associated H-X9-DG protein